MSVTIRHLLLIISYDGQRNRIKSILLFTITDTSLCNLIDYITLHTKGAWCDKMRFPSWHCWYFVNKLEINVNQIISATYLNLSCKYWIKTDMTDIPILFSIFILKKYHRNTNISIFVCFEKNYTGTLGRMESFQFMIIRDAVKNQCDLTTALAIWIASTNPCKLKQMSQIWPAVALKTTL